MRSLGRSAFSLMFLFTAACGGGQNSSTTQEESVSSNIEGASMVTCSSDLECTSGSVCVGGVCEYAFDQHDPNADVGADSGASCADLYVAVSDCYGVYYDCVSVCEDQACADSCVADYDGCFNHEVSLGSEQGQSEFDAVRSCEEEVYPPCYDEGGEVYENCTQGCATQNCADGCADQANTYLSDCLIEGCFDAYSDCGVLTDASDSDSGSNGSNDGSSNGSGGSNEEVVFTCSELYECEDSCDGNQTCGQNCYDHGSDQAQSQWTTLIQCGQIYCDGNVVDAQEYRMCLQQMCPSQYNTCFSETSTGGGSGGGGGSSGSTGTGGYGTDTCGEGYGCIQSCYDTSFDENSFYACVDVCYNNMSTEAIGLMGNLSSCSNYECADVPGSIANYYQCQQDFCALEYNACMAHSNAGSSGGSGGSSGGGQSVGPHDTCFDVYQATIDVCSADYNDCANGCTTDQCGQACGDAYNDCVDAQLDAAPASEASLFQDVLDCWETNYDACYAAGGDVYNACSTNCASWDENCLSDCNDSANAAYQDCYNQECASAYENCDMVDGGSDDSAGSDQTSDSDPTVPETCLDIHLGVLDTCVTAYDACLSQCSSDACAQECGSEIQTCIADLQNAAPADAASDFQDVRDCRSNNYETCYAEGDAAYATCSAGCGGDADCESACNTPANEAYEACFFDTCASEYETCGIQE